MDSFWSKLADALEAPHRAEAEHGQLQWTGSDGSRMYISARDDGCTWTIIDRAGSIRSQEVLAAGLCHTDYQ